jgi:hypothetical protein
MEFHNPHPENLARNAILFVMAGLVPDIPMM